LWNRTWTSESARESEHRRCRFLRREHGAPNR
jgi:hypothetical protein